MVQNFVRKAARSTAQTFVQKCARATVQQTAHQNARARRFVRARGALLVITVCCILGGTSCSKAADFVHGPNKAARFTKMAKSESDAKKTVLQTNAPRATSDRTNFTVKGETTNNGVASTKKNTRDAQQTQLAERAREDGALTFWSDYPADVLAGEIVSRMSNEELLAQLFMFGWAGAEPSKLVTYWVETRNIGSIKIFGWNTDDIERVAKNIATLQQKSLSGRFKIPLFVATDQEGGWIRHVKGATSDTPGNLAIGAAGYPQDAYYSGYYIAKELKALGINMNFAPAVDLYTDHNSSVIGPRSFGENPEFSAILGSAFTAGTLAAGVIPTAKHFPGHGDTGLDSHGKLPVIPIDRETLFRRELLPFLYLIEQKIPAIMTGHLAFPNITASEEPASLSKTFLRDILRGELGYRGLIISDDMMMNGATAYAGGLSQAVTMAIEAGNNILCSSTTPQIAAPLWERNIALMKSDEAFKSIVKDSAYRVIKAKLEYFKDDDEAESDGGTDNSGGLENGTDSENNAATDTYNSGAPKTKAVNFETRAADRKSSGNSETNGADFEAAAFASVTSGGNAARTAGNSSFAASRGTTQSDASAIGKISAANRVPIIPNVDAVSSAVPDKEGEAFFLEQACRSITVYKRGDFPYQTQSAGKVLIASCFAEFFDEGKKRYTGADTFYFKYSPTNEEIASAARNLVHAAKSYDTIIISVMNDASARIARALKESGARVVVVSGLAPVPVMSGFEWADSVVMCYSYSPFSFRAVFAALAGDFEPHGVLPLSEPEQKP